MKLKFDRLISFNIRTDEKIVVPQGELWKISFYQNTAAKLSVNGLQPGYDNIQTGTVVQGVEIKGYSGVSASINGVAFKVVV